MSERITPEMMRDHVKVNITNTALHWTRQNLLHRPNRRQIVKWLREIATEIERGHEKTEIDT
jgi:hypothetical protein